MQLPIEIGISSSSTGFSADLSTLPHLFLSYSAEEQFSCFSSHAARLVVAANPLTVFVSAVSSATMEKMNQHIPPKNVRRTYPQPVTNGHGDSPRKFLNDLLKLSRRRIGQGEKKKNLPNESPVIVFVEHLVELILIRQRRDLAINFIRLLLEGPLAGIHCILGSPISFQNLTRQLIQVHPTVREMLETTLAPNHRLGAELVMSAEGLNFFRRRDEMEYQKFYTHPNLQ